MITLNLFFLFFFFNVPATTEIYTLSLHDALPISPNVSCVHSSAIACELRSGFQASRSEEHTSELQSPCNLVCRLLLEKKKSMTALNVKWRVIASSYLK